MHNPLPISYSYSVFFCSHNPVTFPELLAVITESYKSMQYTMPRYEVRFSGKEEWEEISDIELVERLYKFYRKITPAIREMISGKELRTPDAVYRLKWRGGDTALP